MTQSPRRTDIDFEKFRKLLLEERDRIQRLDRRQRADILQEMEDATDNELAPQFSFDPADDADTAAAANDYGREQALEENERDLLRQINNALIRIDDGTYGLSEVSGKPIPIERLKAVPWATMTVDEAERYAQ